jgi:hypothetical protein
VCQKADNPLAGYVETMKQRFKDFNQVAISGVKKAGNEFLGSFQNFKYRIIDLKSRVFDIQKAENYFSGQFDHLKNRFIELVQVAFRMIRKQKMISH